MKVIDPGHEYKLQFLDETLNDENKNFNRLIFVKREGEKYPGNIGHHSGTTIQEVLRVLIDRVKYLNNQIYDNRNQKVITSLRNAIILLEERAAERHGRNIHPLPLIEIEYIPTCEKCLHIGCKGECHP